MGPLEHAHFRPFPGSIMGRGLLLGSALLDGRRIILATSHLESFVPGEAGIVSQRCAQLKLAGRWLQEEMKRVRAVAAIFLGDMNWDDKDGDPLDHLGDGWKDVWGTLGSPADRRYTYDGKENGMLAHRYRSRLDRCYLLSAESSTQATVVARSMALVGREQVGDRLITKQRNNGQTRRLPLFPSDHFGLLVHFDLEAPAKPQTVGEAQAGGRAEPDSHHAHAGERAVKRPRTEPGPSKAPAPTGRSAAEAIVLE